MEAGHEFGIRPTGPSDIRRIEGAIFNWGADMTYENNPLEMGLERLVDWDLADDASISMQALRAIKEQGVARRINGVELDGDPFPELNNVKWPVVEGDEPIGTVTSAIHSPRLGSEHRVRVAAGRARPTSARRVDRRDRVGDRGAATVVEMPFVDPGKQIPVS